MHIANVKQIFHVPACAAPLSPAGSEELAQEEEQECVLFFSHWLEVQLSKHSVAAHIISDLEHETALQVLRILIEVSSTSVSLFIRMCIELLSQWHGKSFHGSSSKTMVE